MSPIAAMFSTVPILVRDCGQILPAALCAIMLGILPSEAVGQEVTTPSAETGTASPDRQVESTTEVRKDSADSNATVASDGVTNLLAEDLVKTWGLFSAKEDTPLSDVWKIVVVDKERQLVCTGTPKGFLVTQKAYENFELKFEWKYVTDPNGNSGVLIFTKNEPRLWPTSMQVQLHQPRAGSIFPSGDATSDNTSEAKDLGFEVGKWNKCRVVAEDGRISVEINGKPAGEVSGCKPALGSIALQSEGSETHFRRMELRLLPKTSVVPKDVPAVESIAPKKTTAEDTTPSTVDDSPPSSSN